MITLAAGIEPRQIKVSREALAYSYRFVVVRTKTAVQGKLGGSPRQKSRFSVYCATIVPDTYGLQHWG